MKVCAKSVPWESEQVKTNEVTLVACSETPPQARPSWCNWNSARCLYFACTSMPCFMHAFKYLRHCIFWAPVNTCMYPHKLHYESNKFHCIFHCMWFDFTPSNQAACISCTVPNMYSLPALQAVKKGHLWPMVSNLQWLRKHNAKEWINDASISCAYSRRIWARRFFLPNNADAATYGT